MHGQNHIKSCREMILKNEMQRQLYRQVECYLATVLELRGIHNHNVQVESHLLKCKD